MSANDGRVKNFKKNRRGKIAGRIIARIYEWPHMKNTHTCTHTCVRHLSKA